MNVPVRASSRAASVALPVRMALAPRSAALVLTIDACTATLQVSIANAATAIPKVKICFLTRPLLRFTYGLTIDGAAAAISTF